jgi:hypothetical protein
MPLKLLASVFLLVAAAAGQAPSPQQRPAIEMQLLNLGRAGPGRWSRR